MELNKFENNSGKKFKGDIPVDELIKLQQKLSRDGYGYGDGDDYEDESPVNNYNKKFGMTKQSSHGSLKAQQKSNFDDFGSGQKSNKADTQHFNSSPGLSQGNDWYNFEGKKSSSNQQGQSHQTNHPSSFGHARNNSKTQQQTTSDPKVNDQWNNFDFNSFGQSNQKPSTNNNNWNSVNNNVNNNVNKQAQGFNSNNWGTPQPQPQQVQSTTNRSMPQQQSNFQNLYQQNNFQQNPQNWNQNQNMNQGQFQGNRGMPQQQPQNNFQGFGQKPQPQNNFQGINQNMNMNMNQGNNAWNNNGFGNAPQNNFNAFNSTGAQPQNRQMQVTDNLLDLADTKPVKLDTASGIMSLYSKK